MAEKKSIIGVPVEISLRLIGAWQNTSCRILKSVIWSTVMTTCLIFQYSYCFKHVKAGELAELLDGLSLTISNTLLFMKILIVWFHRRLFSQILLKMDEDWNRCKTGWSMEIMMQRACLSHRIANSVVVIFACSVTMYVMSTYFGAEEEENIVDASYKKFILKMEFPFEATVSPLYEIIVAIQLVSQFTFCLMAGMFMALIATLVIHVGSQLDVAGDRLMHILDPSQEERLRLSQIKTVIAKHQRTISLSGNIESVFTLISLLQFFLNIVVLCFVSFILTRSLTSENGSNIFVQCFGYLMAVNFEAFVLCYTGEYLSSKSKNIGLVAYNLNWYELSMPEMRALMLLIIRSQKPLTLTIGKFMGLSLETFGNMLKVSASYVSVLYAME